MVDQSINLPVTPKSADSDAGNSRRHSMGKATSSTSGEKILPHYLRASTGSCHDFCKYGRKHAFEEKARRPSLRRNAKKPPDQQNSLELQPEINKTSKVRHKSGPNTPSNTPEIIKWEVSRKPHNRQTPVISEVMAEKKTSSADRLSPMLREVLAKKKVTSKEVLTESVDSQSSASSENWTEQRKTSTQERKKTSTSTDPKTHLSPKIMRQDVSSSSENLEVSLKQVPSKVKEDNMSAKRASFLKLKLSSPDSSTVSNVRGNGDNKIGHRKVTSKIAGKRVQMSPRDLLSAKTSSSGIARGLASPRASLSLKPTTRLQMPLRASLSTKTASSGIARGPASPRISLTLRPSLSRVASLNARKHRGSEVASPLKNQNKIVKAKNEHLKIKHDDLGQSIKGPNHDVVQEKTLYIIKMETENKYMDDRKENNSAESSPPPVLLAKSPALPESPLLSSHNEEDEEESEYTVTEAEDDSVSEYDETEYMEEADTLEGEHKWGHNKVGMVPSQDMNDQAMKLRFRRGKVIDIQTHHNSPRRLKFRRGRVLEDNQNFKADARRSFKRRGAKGHTDDSRPDSEKVILRHQDVHGKKDAQGLFNNVIEETASKLVETRKSKVKALVSAFETVISLQDRKPPTNSVS